MKLSGGYEELPDCKPTTLTWTNRATKYTGWSISHELFTVSIRDTYYGSIPMRLVKNDQILRSPDKMFTIIYGDVTTHVLTLNWWHHQFEFSKVNDIRTNRTKKEYFIEYDYWLCIGA
ncbi:hypothetical protein KI688_002510 [Linnemannia hyalina]|uniref:Uncharacterized protein n=1 Tax=Linnemannia hyalina TaxID=64524 RepID=A0A9P8BTP9_9FUNG|nr:hypothetical protein KI688_002510 [Linnemannia hyalina]